MVLIILKLLWTLCRQAILTSECRNISHSQFFIFHEKQFRITFCVCVHAHQRTACRSQFFPCTMLTLGVELRSSRLVGGLVERSCCPLSFFFFLTSEVIADLQKIVTGYSLCKFPKYLHTHITFFFPGGLTM